MGDDSKRYATEEEENALIEALLCNWPWGRTPSSAYLRLREFPREFAVLRKILNNGEEIRPPPRAQRIVEYCSEKQEKELRKQLEVAFPRGGWHAEKIQRLLGGSGMMVQWLLLSLFNRWSSPGTNSVREQLTEWKMLCGRMTLDSNFTEVNFPLGSDTCSEVLEYHFKSNVMGHRALEELERIGYEGSSLAANMRYLEIHRDRLMKHPLVLIGVRWRKPGGQIQVPVANWDHRPAIILQPINSIFAPICGFLIKKKDTAQKAVSDLNRPF